jgi:MFS family permease
VTDSAALLVIVFLVYGLYFGLTEGVEKAWVADLAPADGRGNAFGIYNAVIGSGALAASLLFGFIWTHVSPPAAFYTGAGFAAAATALLYLMFSSESRPGRRLETTSGVLQRHGLQTLTPTTDENHSGHQRRWRAVARHS